MKAWGHFLIFIALSYSCQSNQDDDFRHFFSDFQKQIDGRPLMRAFLEGHLAFDSTIVTIQPAEVDSLSSQINSQLEILKSFSQERLSPDLYLYHQRTEDFLALLVKHLLIDQIHQTHPDFYDPRPRLKFLLQKETSRSEWSDAFRAIAINYESATQMLLSANPEQAKSATQQGIEVFQILSSDDLEQMIGGLEEVASKTDSLGAQLIGAELATKSFIGMANSLYFESRDTVDVPH